jgi:hypothetical protein
MKIGIAMERLETELRDDAIARWENEGGTIRPSSKSDGRTRILLNSSLFPSIALSLFPDFANHQRSPSLPCG